MEKITCQNRRGTASVIHGRRVRWVSVTTAPRHPTPSYSLSMIHIFEQREEEGTPVSASYDNR